MIKLPYLVDNTNLTNTTQAVGQCPRQTHHVVLKTENSTGDSGTKTILLNRAIVWKYLIISFITVAVFL
jgi:hypothetical protein